MTRQWQLPPEELCDNHLRGEWSELWKVLGSIKAENMNPVIAQCGYMNLQLNLIPDRLRELYAEMIRRGWNPNEDLLSEIPDWLPEVGVVKPELNRRALELRDCDCFADG